jgi:hypothetical protein
MAAAVLPPWARRAASTAAAAAVAVAVLIVMFRVPTVLCVVLSYETGRYYYYF